MTTDFASLGLHTRIVQTLTELQHTTPTPIQADVIPAMLAGSDVIGQAQTGTGKTAAFALPILQALSEPGPVRALVVTPTRELAMQVAKAFLEYGRSAKVRVLAVYGGQPYRSQLDSLRRGVDVVVGTPGRILDLIQRKSLDLSAISTLVLDEADEMLSMGFITDVEAIMESTPASRQTALFSATVPRPIRTLADRYMRDPLQLSAGPQRLTVAAIQQRHYLVNESDKLAALTRLFEIEPITRALIFTRTRIGTGELAGELTARGIPAEALNGDMSQDAREQTLGRFRGTQVKVLVATDVAARGLDIDAISHVINYDLPRDPGVYVHRIGRTGRAGASGEALTLVTPRERYQLRRIETIGGQKIERAPVPTPEDIHAKRDADLKEQMQVWLRRGRCSKERGLIEELLSEGHELSEIAAVALKLAKAQEKQRPIAPMDEVREERPRRDRRFSPPPRGRGGARPEAMVRLSLDTGSAHGVRVNHIVSSIAHFAQIPGNALGKIRVMERHTLVDVPQEIADRVLARTGAYRIGRKAVNVERAPS